MARPSPRHQARSIRPFAGVCQLGQINRSCDRRRDIRLRFLHPSQWAGSGLGDRWLDSRQSGLEHPLQASRALRSAVRAEPQKPGDSIAMPANERDAASPIADYFRTAIVAVVAALVVKVQRVRPASTRLPSLPSPGSGCPPGELGKPRGPENVRRTGACSGALSSRGAAGRGGSPEWNDRDRVRTAEVLPRPAVATLGLGCMDSAGSRRQRRPGKRADTGIEASLIAALPADA